MTPISFHSSFFELEEHRTTLFSYGLRQLIRQGAKVPALGLPRQQSYLDESYEIPDFKRMIDSVSTTLAARQILRDGDSESLVTIDGICAFSKPQRTLELLSCLFYTPSLVETRGQGVFERHRT